MCYNHLMEAEIKKLGRPRLINYEEVIQQIQEKKIAKIVAEEMNISAGHVRFLARTHSVKIDDQRGKCQIHPRKIPLDKEKIIQRYLSGEGTNEIGKSLGIRGEVVRRRLKKWNIPRRVGKAVGQKNPQWKGGKYQAVHYFRRQSYEVAAICLGQPVPKGYVIHHLDENKENNNPENLVLFPSLSAHTKFHQKVLNLQFEAGSKEANQQALESGAIPLPQPPHPLLFLQSKEEQFPSNKTERQ